MTLWIVLYMIGAAGMALYLWAYADESGLSAKPGMVDLAVGVCCVLLWHVLLAMSIIAKIDQR